MRDLTRATVYFFAGGPYRFLMFLLAGATVIGGGIYEDWTNFRRASVGHQCLAAGIFLVYFMGSIWYGCLIYHGSWKTSFWDHVIAAISYFE